MIRPLIVSAIVSALATFTAAMSLHASDAVLAVAAVGAVTVLVTWLTGQHSDDDTSGLAMANPAWTIGLAFTGRVSPVNIVPMIAAQIVGAVLAGLAALALESRLPDAIVWAPPNLVAVAVVTVILAIMGIWLLFAIDQQLTEPFAAIGPMLAGGTLPLGLASVLNPAVVIGMGVAELVTWSISATAVAGVIVGTVAGAFLGRTVSPQE